MKNLYNMKELAEELGVERRTISRWVKSGKIKSSVPNKSKRILFSKEDLFSLKSKDPSLKDILIKVDYIVKILEELNLRLPVLPHSEAKQKQPVRIISPTGRGDFY